MEKALLRRRQFRSHHALWICIVFQPLIGTFMFGQTSAQKEEQTLPNNLPGEAHQLAPSGPLPATGDLRTAQMLSLTETKVKAESILQSTSSTEVKAAAEEVLERSDRQMKLIDNLLLNQQKVQVANGLDVQEPKLFQVAIELTREGSNPYQDFICGGTLIRPSWILTAYHCIPNKDHPEDIWIWAGSQYLETNSGTSTSAICKGGSNTLGITTRGTSNTNGQVQCVDRVVTYPSPYDSNTGANDLALLHLTTPITDLPVVTLQDNDNVEELAASGQQLTLLGWGAVNTQTGRSTNLKYAYLLAQPQNQCSREYSGNVTGNSFCAGAIQVGPCAGDSGGPLLESQGVTYIQDGIVSQINGMCGTTAALFTRVASYAAWINQQTVNTTP